MDAIQSEMRCQIVMNFYQQNSSKEMHFWMDGQTDRQTQRPKEMRGRFTIMQFSKEGVLKITIYDVQVDQGVIINLFRSIKENIVKNCQ